MAGVETARKLLASESNANAVAHLTEFMNKTRTNDEFRVKVREWIDMPNRNQ